MDLDVEVSKVVFVRDGADAGDTEEDCERRERLSGAGYAHGSAMSRSVSLMIRLGSAMLELVSESQTRPGLGAPPGSLSAGFTALS